MVVLAAVAALALVVLAVVALALIATAGVVSYLNQQLSALANTVTALADAVAFAPCPSKFSFHSEIRLDGNC